MKPKEELAELKRLLGAETSKMSWTPTGLDAMTISADDAERLTSFVHYGAAGDTFTVVKSLSSRHNIQITKLSNGSLLWKIRE